MHVVLVGVFDGPGEDRVCGVVDVADGGAVDDEPLHRAAVGDQATGSSRSMRALA